MKESVAIVNEADAKKDFSSTRSDNSIHRVRDEPERQFGSLRVVINIRRCDGGAPSVDSIATHLSSMRIALMRCWRFSELVEICMCSGKRTNQKKSYRFKSRLLHLSRP